MNNKKRKLAIAISLSLLSHAAAVIADDSVDFNTDFLDVKDRKNISVGQFSMSGYVIPGQYWLAVKINGTTLPDEYFIDFIVAKNKPTGSASVPCLTRELVDQFGLKPDVVAGLRWQDNPVCMVPGQLDGVMVKGNLNQSTLEVSIPQAFLEYTDQDWDPPARWDTGINGGILDYHIDGQFRHDQQDGAQMLDLTGNGVAGLNLDAWRMRADWQLDYSHDDRDSDESAAGQQLEWTGSRYYAYRPIPLLRSKLTLGEDYLQSDVFDSFSFIGASLVSDDTMLPPNLQGYAPEIVGVAHSNAKVTITQLGRILYQTQVPAGPFRLQDLSQSVSGELDVKVEEQNGDVQQFTVNTASVPFLTRPGLVRYKLALGRPQMWEHKLNGPMFASAEASWGVSNGWSLYGGLIGDEHYRAVALGVGRDLSILGALSADVTRANADVDGKGTFRGNSWRLSYSKRFDEYHSNITFAGYRFSDRNYMSMSDYLDAPEYAGDRQEDQYYRDGYNYRNKEMYTITFNQNIPDYGLSFYLNYSRRTYWNQSDENNYSLSLAKTLEIGRFKNISMSLTGYRNQSSEFSDDGVYISFSMPIGDNDNVSYNSTLGKNSAQRLGYYGRINAHSNYQINAGVDSGDHISADGYYSQEGAIGKSDLTISYLDGDYASAGFSLEGGATLTAKGGALHPVSSRGSSRLLLDTSGVPDVAMGEWGSATRSNRFGKAVIADMGMYTRRSVGLDLRQLPDKAEASRSVVQATLTEGAIGYREFDVITGERVLAVLRLVNGEFPPFGAEVLNARRKMLGVLADDGNVFLAGVKAGERVLVRQEGHIFCQATLPAVLPAQELTQTLLLPCAEVNENDIKE
ncbi:outer membrane usher protein [Superficieibacter electus]|nr:outer membrane usher protein [Superficieibacter electus]